jgi:hypothetical protein
MKENQQESPQKSTIDKTRSQMLDTSVNPLEKSYWLPDLQKN